MLSDPQTISVSAIAIPMPKVKIEGSKTTYQSADGLHRLIIQSTESKANTRYLVRFEEDVVSPDPISSVNKKVTLSMYLVVDQPAFGIDDTRAAAIWAGFTGLVTSSLLTKILGGES